MGLAIDKLNTPRIAGTSAISAGTRKTVHQEQVGWVMNHQIEGDLKLNTRMYRGDRSNLQYQSSNTWVGLERQYFGLGANLQGQRDGAVPVLWTVGVDADQSGEQRQGGTTASGQISGVPNRNEWNQANTTDLFAQANWLLSESYTLVTGTRNTKARLRSKDQYLSDGDGSGEVTYRATNPVLGLTWHANQTWNFYANIGRGFETPTLAEAAYSTAVVGGNRVIQGRFNPVLQAATSRHQEVGAKFADAQGTRLNLAIFDIQTQNEIVTDINASGKTAFTNASLTRRKGVELSWQQAWGKHWRTDAAMTAMQAQFSQGYSFVNSGTNYVVNAGNRLTATPDRIGLLAWQWSQTGWDAGRLPVGWLASMEWQGRSRLWANDVNSAAAGGYGLANFKLRHRQAWAGGTFEPYLGIDNLQDKKVIGSVIVNQYSGGGYYEPALPRTWVLGLQAKWAL